MGRRGHTPPERRHRARTRARAAGLAALLLGTVAQTVCSREPERAGSRPNVIVYLVDTLRKDHLSVYGYSRETSPRLAEFARDAVRFETAYSPTSWTRPAVASRFNDLCFGTFLDFLRAEDLYDDTVVIFTSDHGEEFRDHGEFGHGLGLFQEVVQVPLLVKLPGSAHGGRVEDRLRALGYAN